MIDHITLKVSNLTRSKVYYEKALAPLGMKPYGSQEDADAIGFGVQDAPGSRPFWIYEDDIEANPSFSCLCLKASSKEQVDAYYVAALSAGGRDNGAPGYREKYHPGYYAAFVLDPDGYNIEAVFDDPDRG